MTTEDQTALWAVASTIAFPIVGDRARTAELTTSAMAWLEGQPGATDAPVPWLASHVVAAAIDDPPVVGRTHDTARTHLAGWLRSAPVASRVAFALHVLCGYDLPTTAALCRRSVADIESLLAPLEPATAGLVELVSPPDPPELPAGRPTAAGIEPSAAPASRTRGRWFRPRGGTVATVILVLLCIVGVTYPGGARPSFADPPLRSSCTPGTGPGTVTTVSVGSAHRPVRLFVPTGAIPARSVVLLVGDSGAPPEDTVATTGLESAAATEGFILVTLDGSSSPWNVGQVPGQPDDLAYARAAIERAEAGACADPSHLAIVGFGTGAHLAAAVACDPTIRVRQLVMVRGTYLPPTCAPPRPVSVLVDVGQKDDVLPISGGWGSTAAPTAGYQPTSLNATYDGWARLDQCGATSTGEVDSSHVVVSSRPRCAAGARVEARVAPGGGHGWPAEAVGATVRFVSGN